MPTIRFIIIDASRSALVDWEELINRDKASLNIFGLNLVNHWAPSGNSLRGRRTSAQ
jgi:hypothetical protein